MFTWIIVGLAFPISVLAVHLWKTKTYKARLDKWTDKVQADYYNNYRNRPIKPEWGEFGAYASLFTMLGALVGMSVGLIPYHHSYVHHSYRLEALQDGKSAYGAFFLGSGVIGDYPSYMFYMNDHGRYHLESVDAGYADVAYTTGPPHVDYTCKFGNPYWDFTAIDDTGHCTVDQQYVTFYVPKGSVKSDYTLDAK